MATETLLPDGVVTSSNLNASIGDLDEGVDSFDGVYATNQGSNGNTLLVLSFPTPSGSLTSGAGLQTFRARVRKNASGGNTTTVRFEIYENGSPVGTVSGDTTISSTTGVDISFTWDSSVLANVDGSGVEIGIAQQSGGQGGRANNRRWIEVDAADWIADYVEPVTAVGYSFSTIF
jgi:hypothetical protein